MILNKFQHIFSKHISSNYYPDYRLTKPMLQITVSISLLVQVARHLETGNKVAKKCT